MMDLLWWGGLGLSTVGLLLLIATTILNLPIVPARFRTQAFWLALLVFFLGISLSVVLT